MTHVVAGDQLKQALSRSAREAGLCISHVSDRSTRWSSCSFVGGKHEMVIVATACDRVRPWLDTLDEHAARVPDHVLCDLVVSTVDQLGEIIVATLHGMTVREV